jgi:hypothetical protein
MNPQVTSCRYEQLAPDIRASLYHLVVGQVYAPMPQAFTAHAEASSRHPDPIQDTTLSLILANRILNYINPNPKATPPHTYRVLLAPVLSSPAQSLSDGPKNPVGSGCSHTALT